MTHKPCLNAPGLSKNFWEDLRGPQPQDNVERYQIESDDLGADQFESSATERATKTRRWKSSCGMLKGKARAHASPSFDGAFRIYGGTSTHDGGALLLGGFIGRNDSDLIRKHGYSFSVDAPPAYCTWEEGNMTAATVALHPWGAAATYSCAGLYPGTFPTMLQSDYGSVSLSWKVLRGNRHEYGVTVCAAPIFRTTSEVDLRAWVSTNLKKHVDRFAIYVRTEAFDHVSRALAWYIDAGIVTLHDIGPSKHIDASIDSSSNTESYNADDRKLHKEYEDQVLWLASCHHTYGYNSRWLISLDIDEVIIGEAESIEDVLPTDGRPTLIPSVAFGVAEGDSCSQNHKSSIPFVRTFTRRQAHSIPRNLAWPRTKLISSPRETSLHWMHRILDPSDSCLPSTRSTERSLRIAHYVDIHRDSYIQGGQCRCDTMFEALRCNVSDFSVAALLPATDLSSNQRYLSYTESEGLNNQIIALRNACWLAFLTDRVLVVSEWILHHRESEKAPARRLRWCEIIDCTVLMKQCPYIYRSSYDELVLPLRTCRTLYCLQSNADLPVIHLRDKVAFQLKFKSSSFFKWFKSSVATLTDPIVPSSVIKSSVEARIRKYRSINSVKNTCVLVAHVRVVSESDYVWHGASKRYDKLWRTTVNALKVMPKNTSIVIMSNACESREAVGLVHKLSNQGYLTPTCLEESATHPMTEVVEQMLFATFADAFAPDMTSTVSLTIMQWRNFSSVANSCSNYEAEGQRMFDSTAQNVIELPQSMNKVEEMKRNGRITRRDPVAMCGAKASKCRDRYADEHTCGKRVRWLMSVRMMSMHHACLTVAVEFPNICGECGGKLSMGQGSKNTI